VHETTRLALGFGVHQSFVITRSHYVNINLVAMSQGYTPGYIEDQLDEIKKAMAYPA
jgi:coproporphyrinogen III oxidase-like Fe-S oxidoreductase